MIGRKALEHLLVHFLLQEPRVKNTTSQHVLLLLLLDLIPQHFSLTHLSLEPFGDIFNGARIEPELPQLHPCYCLVVIGLIDELATARAA